MSTQISVLSPLVMRSDESKHLCDYIAKIANCCVRRQLLMLLLLSGLTQWHRNLYDCSGCWYRDCQR